MHYRKNNDSHFSDEENPYWISFSDIMSGLLVIFILASLVLIMELIQTKTDVSEAIKEIAKAEEIRRNILNEIEEKLREKNIQVEISENDTVLRIPDHLLTFKSNKYDIPKDEIVQSMVLEIGHILYQTISEGNRWQFLDTIFIEGHTDNRVSRRIMGNWGLSTFRAIAVWNYWTENLEKEDNLSALKNHNGTPLFSVSGYAETRPVQFIQETEEEYQKNRRIDIRFTVRRPKLVDFENIKKLLEE